MRNALFFLTLCFTAIIVFLIAYDGRRSEAQTIAAATPWTSSTAAEACHVFATRPVNMTGYSVTSGATAGFIMVFDAATAPADGAVTPALPAQTIAATATVQYQPTLSPARFGNGLVICFSSTGPFTKTASATAAIGAQFQ